MERTDLIHFLFYLLRDIKISFSFCIPLFSFDHVIFSFSVPFIFTSFFYILFLYFLLLSFASLFYLCLLLSIYSFFPSFLYFIVLSILSYLLPPAFFSSWPFFLFFFNKLNIQDITEDITCSTWQWMDFSVCHLHMRVHKNMKKLSLDLCVFYSLTI